MLELPEVKEVGDNVQKPIRRSTRLSAKQLNDLILTRATSIDFPHYDREDTLPGLPNLAISANAGCEFCRFLRDSILSERAGFVNKATSTEVHDVSLKLRVSWFITPLKEGRAAAAIWLLQLLATSYESWGQDEDKKEIVIRASICWPIGLETGQSSFFGIPKPIPPGALQDDPLAFVKTNIERYLAGCKHAGTADHRFLPSRLVDVTGQVLRVISPGGFPIKIINLGSDIQKRLEFGFSLDELAPIQRDAVGVARALPIPFIWIDALCILQDSRKDWEQESAKMDRIYANSHVTIFVLTSKSCQDGFLLRPSHPRRIKVPYDPIAATVSEFYELEHAAIYDHPSPAIWNESNLENNEWNTRGWTFQEQLMPARMMYFGNSGMYFSCSNRLYSGVEQEPQSLILHNILSLRNATSLYQAWYNHIAKLYSSRKITYTSDTLPALSGLARQFASAASDQYVAGLWKRDLLHDLFWVLHHPTYKSLAELTKSLIEPQIYIAPSWSWAREADCLSSCKADEI
ncbi:heterokaryon incompatibility protein-domain-containing protein [Hypoxylon trugodes]|uniref:heterokaryon incompatibility protein-domain-containing protein n=1 Tax=Hypoxylon trugodes TaxID=326681 RepID=UPI00219AD0A8|nr:heterokaryon incompatibility protein-domain-containing protein [Hypoxylon trugodes]KAI1385787.1 heterokaryon incompatibility protein-domain-containing protein [Hypoxylon trugodes]